MRLQVGSNGWINNGVLHRPSPNCDDRPEHAMIELVVMHAISLPKGQYHGDWIERLFLNQLDGSEPWVQALKPLRVSAHFLIRRRGDITQFVSCNQRAWHAGVSCFLGKANCNDFSIGIELEGTDDMPFTSAQYTRLIPLIQSLSEVYPLRYMTGHEDIAKGRKTDPGAHFNWHLLQDTLPLSRI